MFTELVGIVAPIYIAIGLGFAWGRSGRHWDRELITELVMTVGAPCLVFSSLVGMQVAPAAMAEMALAAVAALATFAVLGAAELKLSGLSIPTIHAPLVFPNAGNMGLPVCLFAFGPEGLALGICFFAVAAFGQYSAGVWIRADASRRVNCCGPRSPGAWCLRRSSWRSRRRCPAGSCVPPRCWAG